MDLKTVFEFKGGYGRKATIKIGNGECVMCKEEKEIFFIDTSEGEYASCRICFNCLKKMKEENK